MFCSYLQEPILVKLLGKVYIEGKYSKIKLKNCYFKKKKH